METVFPEAIRVGLHAARHAKLRRDSRLRLDINGKQHPVLRMWKTGFAIATEDAPTLRGLVDLYDGTDHLFQCLIVADDPVADGETHYEFKRATPVATAAALDFEKSPTAPVALIDHVR